MEFTFKQLFVHVNNFAVIVSNFVKPQSVNGAVRFDAQISSFRITGPMADSAWHWPYKSEKFFGSTRLRGHSWSIAPLCKLQSCDEYPKFCKCSLWSSVLVHCIVVWMQQALSRVPIWEIPDFWFADCQQPTRKPEKQRFTMEECSLYVFKLCSCNNERDVGTH